MGWGQQQMLTFLGGEGYCYFLANDYQKGTCSIFSFHPSSLPCVQKVLQTKSTTGSGPLPEGSKACWCLIHQSRTFWQQATEYLTKSGLNSKGLWLCIVSIEGQSSVLIWWFDDIRALSQLLYIFLISFLWSSWSQDGCHNSKHHIIHHNIQRHGGKDKFTSCTSVLFRMENISQNSPIDFPLYFIGQRRGTCPHSSPAPTDH